MHPSVTADIARQRRTDFERRAAHSSLAATARRTRRSAPRRLLARQLIVAVMGARIGQRSSDRWAADAANVAATGASARA